MKRYEGGVDSMNRALEEALLEAKFSNLCQEVRIEDLGDFFVYPSGSVDFRRLGEEKWEIFRSSY